MKCIVIPRAQLPPSDVRPVNVTHERVVRGSHASENASSCQFPHTIKGKDNIEVSVGIGMVVVVVCDRQLVTRRGRGNQAKRGISLWIVHIERRVCLHVQASRGD
jgi:hypothetical protein